MNIPAFPDVDELGDPHSGMTLRDYFAAKAMQALIARYTNMLDYDNWDENNNLVIKDHIKKVVSQGSYIFADAMIEVRK